MRFLQKIPAEKISCKRLIMSTIGMIVIGLIYAISSYDQFTKDNVGMALAFAGWSMGQMGMAYAVRG
jgi:glucose uptake protein GlcU